ncbi:MAG: hypothetical protein GY751_08870 [Bacteroidetes bacterium]|nr:hypothetical protein [Bacteroidota bacterium]
MSWEITYRKLYTCGISHAFYTENVSDDLGFSLMQNTSRVLSAHGIVFKPSRLGFDLVYKTDDGGYDPCKIIDENIVLHFSIEASNVELFNITEFPAKADDSDIYLVEDLYSESNLDLSIIGTRQLVFTESYTYTSELVTFRVLDAMGHKVFEETKAGVQDDVVLTDYHFAFSVNLGSGLKIGKYQLKTLIDGIEKDNEDVFIFNRLEYPDLIGVFALELDASIVYDSNLPYASVIELVPSSAVWVYNVFLTRNYTNGVFALNNSGGPSPTFSETTSLPDYLEGETVIFESSVPITKLEAPIKDFNLVVTSDDQNITLSGLPNPSPYKANSTIYLKI